MIDPYGDNCFVKHFAGQVGIVFKSTIDSQGVNRVAVNWISPVDVGETDPARVSHAFLPANCFSKVSYSMKSKNIQYHLKIGTLVLFGGNLNGIIISRSDSHYYEVLHEGSIHLIHRDDLIEVE